MELRTQCSSWLVEWDANRRGWEMGRAVQKQLPGCAHEPHPCLWRGGRQKLADINQYVLTSVAKGLVWDPLLVAPTLLFSSTKHRFLCQTQAATRSLLNAFGLHSTPHIYRLKNNSCRTETPWRAVLNLRSVNCPFYSSHSWNKKDLGRVEMQLISMPWVIMLFLCLHLNQL